MVKTVWYDGVPLDVLKFEAQVRANTRATRNKIVAKRAVNNPDSPALIQDAKYAAQALADAFQQYLDQYYRTETTKITQIGTAAYNIRFRNKIMIVQRYTTQFGMHFLGFSLTQESNALKWCVLDIFAFIRLTLFCHLMRSVDNDLIDQYWTFDLEQIQDAPVTTEEGLLIALTGDFRDEV